MPHPAIEIERARNHLTNPASYAPFDLIAGQVMGGCVDPRAEELDGERHLVKVQGPGGEIGRASDLAIALTVTTGEVVTAEQALKISMALNRPSVPGAHHDCAFADLYLPIMEERAEPSDPTEETVERWLMDNLEMDFLITRSVRQRAKDGAARQVEHLRGQGQSSMAHLADSIDEAHPRHGNVKHMRGAPTPHFYVANLTQRLGLDRHRLHATEKLQAQAYHDNVTARLMEMLNIHPLAAEERLLMMGALLYRSAATRTKIEESKRAAGQPLEHWEITDGKHGPEFRQVEVAI